MLLCQLPSKRDVVCQGPNPSPGEWGPAQLPLGLLGGPLWPDWVWRCSSVVRWATTEQKNPLRLFMAKSHKIQRHRCCEQPSKGPGCLILSYYSVKPRKFIKKNLRDVCSRFQSKDRGRILKEKCCFGFKFKLVTIRKNRGLWTTSLRETYLIMCLLFVPVPCCFNYCCFSGESEIRSMIPPALFFSLQTVLAVWGPLWSHVKFSIIWYNSGGNVKGILIRIALNT